MEQKNQALNEAKKRFQQIMEYITVNGPILGEADDDQDPNAQGAPQGEATMGGAPDMNGGGDMGGDPNAMPQDPNMMGGDPNAMGGNQGGPQGFNPQVPQDGGDPNMGGDPNAMPQDPNMMGGDMPMDDPNGIQPDDEVIDISDLTDSQEATENKVEKINDKFDKVLKTLSKFEDMIKANDEKINSFKSEFEKRNPTQMEKLSMRASQSYPFNVTPEQYWKEKEATSNYRVEDDDNGKGQEQYTITSNDLNNANDWKTLSDSLSDYDIYHQTLKNTMKL